MLGGQFSVSCKWRSSGSKTHLISGWATKCNKIVNGLQGCQLEWSIVKRFLTIITGANHPSETLCRGRTCKFRLFGKPIRHPAKTIAPGWTPILIHRQENNSTSVVRCKRLVNQRKVCAATSASPSQRHFTAIIRLMVGVPVRGTGKRWTGEKKKNNRSTWVDNHRNDRF